MNTLLIHQKTEEPAISRLLIRGLLISLCSFILLLLSLLMFPTDTTKKQTRNAVSKSLVQASFTAISSLPLQSAEQLAHSHEQHKGPVSPSLQEWINNWTNKGCQTLTAW